MAEQLPFVDGGGGGDMGGPNDTRWMALLNEVEEDLEQELVPEDNNREIENFVPWDEPQAQPVENQFVYTPSSLASFNPLYVLVSAWREYAMLKSMFHNFHLVGEFWELVKQVYKHNTPVELIVVYDGILEQTKMSKEVLASSTSIVDNKVYPFEHQITTDLRTLLQWNMNFMAVIADINTRLQQKIEIYGYLFPKSPETKLCNQTCQKLMSFMDHLDVFVDVVLKHSPDIPDLAEVRSIASRVGLTWREGVLMSVTENISFSAGSQIKDFFLGALEGMFCATGILLYFLQYQHNPSGVYHKLSNFVMDLTITIREYHYAIDGFIQMYEYTSVPARKPSVPGDMFQPRTYTREAKLAYHSHEIVSWCAEFSVHSQLLKETAKRLKDTSRLMNAAGADEIAECKGIAEEIDQLQTISEDYVKKLDQLVGIQNALLQDVLRRLLPSSARVSVPPPRIWKSSKNENKENVNVTKSVGIQVKEPEEFKSEGVAEGAVGGVGVPYIAEADEVYFAKFEDDGEDSDQGGPDRDPGVKVAKSVFSGVMDQLRNVLRPVKSAMIRREQQAVVKTYGSATVEDSETDEMFFDVPEPEPEGESDIERFRLGPSSNESGASDESCEYAASNVIQLHVRDPETMDDSDDDPIMSGFIASLKKRVMDIQEPLYEIYETQDGFNNAASTSTFKTAGSDVSSMISHAANPEKFPDSPNDLNANKENGNAEELEATGTSENEDDDLQQEPIKILNNNAENDLFTPDPYWD